MQISFYISFTCLLQLPILPLINFSGNVELPVKLHRLLFKIKPTIKIKKNYNIMHKKFNLLFPPPVQKPT